MELSKQLKERGVILEGHFKLTSGRHSDKYVNKDTAFCDPYLFKTLFQQFLYCQGGMQYDVVTGPAIAGAVLAAPVGLFLDKVFVYPEKVEGKMVFRRGYDKIIKDQKVLILEDIITTGGSVQKTIDSIKECGGIPMGVIAIWNRSGWKPVDCLCISMVNEQVKSWEPDECPLCKEGIPLQDPKAL